MKTKVLRSWRSISYAAEVALLMVSCAVIAYWYTLAWAISRVYPWSVEYEGHVFWAAQRLSQGINIYDLSTLTHQPWCVIIYNPLYLIVGAALIKLLGAVYWPFRILTMCSTLLTFLGLFVILDRCKLREFVSIIGLALFASSLPVFYWSGVARVDMFGLALGIWGVERFTAFWLENEKMSRSRAATTLAVSLGLFVFSFFTKQQYFLFPLACSLFLMVKGRTSLGLKFFGSWLAIVLVSSTGIQLITGGYWAHLSYAAGLPWEWKTLKIFLLPFLTDYKTIAAGIVILAGSLVSKRKAPLEELAQILVALSLPLAIYTMGLRGAYHNHLLCAELGLFWLTALNLGKLAGGFSALTILSIALSLQTMLIYFGVLSSRLILWESTTRTIAFLKNLPLKGKQILSEDPFLPMAVGAVPAIIDGTTVMNMVYRHPDQLAQLIGAIRNKDFMVIVINRGDAERNREDIWPRSVINEIKKHYRLVGTTGGNGIRQCVFVPER